MIKRVVILGGGTGGLMVANRLARAVKEDGEGIHVEITLIADAKRHLYQPGLLYVALGLSQPSVYHRPQQSLLLPPVHLKEASAERIDVENHIVMLEGHEKIHYDYLVIATGSHPDLDAIPGFRKGGHSFYTFAEAMQLRQTLTTFEKGKLLMVVGVPHKCPVAPLEFLLMYEDMLRKNGKREGVELMYTYPIGRLHSLEPVADWAEGIFEQRGIESETFFNVETVDPSSRTVYTLEGEEVSYDLLVGIPPHRGAKVIRDSELGDPDGWLPTDPKTLQMKGASGVYVVGDATDLPLSKAGSTAHYESDIVVQNLMHEMRGEPPLATYDGKVFCFIEGSTEAATHITFDYHHPPTPALPSNTVHWFKLAFNQMYWASLRGLV